MIRRLIARRQQKRAARRDPATVLDLASLPVHLLAVDDPARLHAWNDHGRWRPPPGTTWPSLVDDV